MTREKTVIRNIISFINLSPSEKIRYVERAKERLKYFRTLKFAPLRGRVKVKNE